MPTASKIKCLARAVTAAGIAADAYAPTKRASSSEMSELATDSGCGDLRAVTGAFIRYSLIGFDGHGFVEHHFFGKPVSTPDQVRGRSFPDHARVVRTNLRPAHGACQWRASSASLGPQRNRITEPIRRMQIERHFDDAVFGGLVDALDLQRRRAWGNFELGGNALGNRHGPQGLNNVHHPLVIHLLDPRVDRTGSFADQRSNARISGVHINLGPANRRRAVRSVAQAFGMEPLPAGAASEPPRKLAVGDYKAGTGHHVTGRNRILHQVANGRDWMQIEGRLRSGDRGPRALAR